MSKFRVTFEYTCAHQAKKVIEAETKEQAWAKAEALALDDTAMGKLDFKPTDVIDSYDAVEIEPA